MSIKTKVLPRFKAILGNEPPKIDVPDFLIESPFLAGFYGVRGSGKSVAMTTLLKKFKSCDKLQRCFLICPTYQSNKHLYEDIVKPEDVYEEASQGSLDKILEEVSVESQTWKMWQDHCALYDEYKRQERLFLAGKRKEIDVDLLFEAVELGIADMEKRPEYKHGNCDHPMLVLVLDDCMSLTLFNGSTKVKNNLSNVCIKHRHLGNRIGLSIMVALQAFKSQTGVLSKSIRNNLTCQCIWGIKDEKLLDSIYQEIGREITKEQFYKMFDYMNI